MADEEPTNTLTDTGMEASEEERQKVGEKFNEAISELKAAGDPSDFVQERIRTTPENKSDAAADDDAYPDDDNDDASQPGYEPGTEPSKADREKKDKPPKKAEPKTETKPSGTTAKV